MNDRYLYKAKRIDNGEWVVGGLFRSVNTDRAYIIFQCKMTEKFDDGMGGFDSLGYEVDPSTICQCTGLRDKNGKLIWENDVLMCNGNPEDLVKAMFGEFYVINVETLEKVDKVIGWHYEVIPTDAISKCEPFCLPMPLTEEYITRCEMEVIGTVFDNPELLEGEKDAVN